MKSVAATISSMAKNFVDFLPPGLVIFFASGFVADGKFIGEFRQEFLGTLLMIICTFSAGKWIGSESMSVAWFSHFLGVIAADYFGGGPHVNPAVTVSMWSLGKCSYTEGYVRIAAQMGGGLCAFPIFHAIAETMKWTPFGGPEFNMEDDEEHAAEAFLSEFGATYLLMLVIYTVNWEVNFGTYHYAIKQSLTAIAIRVLIEVFPTAGPAMNPMLGTTWAVFGVGDTFEFPDDMDHYVVYWVAPVLAAVLASVSYAIYDGCPLFGVKLPLGPIKKKEIKKKTS